MLIKKSNKPRPNILKLGGSGIVAGIRYVSELLSSFKFPSVRGWFR